MRFKDFLITLLISTVTSLIVIWTLINAGIIPTRQQYPQLHLKQQHHSGTLIGVLNETSKMYEANIVRLPIENVSDKADVLVYFCARNDLLGCGGESSDV